MQETLPADTARILETLAALRAAARYRNKVTGQRHFAHDKIYRAAFVRGILLRRDALRKLRDYGNIVV